MLYSYMEEPGKLDVTSLHALGKVVEAYPWFHTSRLLYTKNLDLTNSDHFGEELAKTAVLCCDRRKLLYLIRQEQYQRFLTSSSENDQQTNDRTETLLNSFLSTLPEHDTNETTLPDANLHVAGTDYFAYLASLGETGEREENNGQPFQHQEIIDAFIEKASTEEIFTPIDYATHKKTEERDKKEEGGEFLTETLARIYIKQQKYEQALTIIKRLSLNFPKKSVYFADQIRFLEYLSANEKKKKNK